MIEIVAVIIGCAVTAFLAVLGFFAVRTLGHIDESMKCMTESINELNIKMGIVIEKTTAHELQIQKLDERTRALEKEPR